MKFVLLIIVGLSLPNPLGLQWGKKYENVPVVANYRYYYGDPDWGTSVHLGQADIIGLSTELQLYYTGKKLSSAVLILGPDGLNNANCIRKYKEAIKMLGYKYGKFQQQHITKDPLIEDLFAISICTSVKTGLYALQTVWLTKTFRIQADLFGNEDGIYIEIYYTFLVLEKHYEEQEKQKILRRL